jgi:hypothetical protein
VFTARYALGPYIKQICFVFKGLIQNFVDTCVGILTARPVTLVPISLKAGKFVSEIVKRQSYAFVKRRRPNYLWVKQVLFSDAQDDGINMPGP